MSYTYKGVDITNYIQTGNDAYRLNNVFGGNFPKGLERGNAQFKRMDYLSRGAKIGFASKDADMAQNYCAKFIDYTNNGFQVVNIENYNSVGFILIGGGGGGGGGGDANQNDNSLGAGGGGAGGLIYGTLFCDSISNITVKVGSGGAGSSAETGTGGGGGTTIINYGGTIETVDFFGTTANALVGGTTYTAPGGSGGNGGGNSTRGSGGGGGKPNIGDYSKYDGSNGGDEYKNNNGDSYGGNGGNIEHVYSYFTDEVGSSAGNGGVNNYNGNAANGYGAGGGGGGGGNHDSNTKSGGNGAPGYMRLYFYVL